MRFADLLRYSLGNLSRQKLRTFLTVFGVVVGTAAITLMVSLGIGLQEQTISFFNKVDLLTSIRVFPQKRSTSLLTFGKSLGGPEMPLDDAAIEEFRRLPGVQAAFPDIEINGPISVERMVDGKRKSKTGRWVAYMGLPEDGIMPAYRESLLAGDFWHGDDPGEQVAVVPGDIFYEMGFGPPLQGQQKPGETPAGKGDPRWNDVIGMQIAIRFRVVVAKDGDKPVDPERPKDGEPAPGEEEVEKDEEESPETVSKNITRRFRVIGVYDTTNVGIPMAPQVFIPLRQGLEMARMRSGRRPAPSTSYRSVIVKLRDASRTAAVQRELDERGYGTMTIQDIVQVIDYVFLMLKAVLGAIASIGLIVAFFGIANTMIMAILERTREIGVMKAVGARNAEIRRLFVVEAAAIGGLGAIFGIAGGWGFGLGLNALASWFVKSRGGPEGVALFVVSPWLAGGTFAFAVIVAVLAGLYPAWRAARLDPVAALRSL